MIMGTGKSLKNLHVGSHSIVDQWVSFY